MENILSKIHKEEIRRGYRKRLLIVWCWLAVAAFPVFLALVVPVYIAGGMRISEIKERNGINESAALGQNQVFEMPTLINKKSEVAASYKSRQAVSHMTESLFAAAPAGIRVAEISFQKADNKKVPTFRISGVAKNREMLSLYEQQIEKLPYIESADVPVESFSRPADLNFNINVSIKN
jgi:hypothetical protein